MKPWERWERQVHEERLLGNHFIISQRERQWQKTKEKMKSYERKLLKGIETNWVYVKSSPPPTIELAWIIYSQMGWKSPHIDTSVENSLDEEELWEDLTEVDPIEICLLCQEIETRELEGSKEPIETLIGTETLFFLKRVLEELSNQGINIQEESFSKNWLRKKKRHKSNKTSGRMQEILAREQDALSKLRADAQKSGLLIKRTIDRKKQKKQKSLNKKSGGSKSPSRILASFFGLA